MKKNAIKKVAQFKLQSGSLERCRGLNPLLDAIALILIRLQRGYNNIHKKNSN